VQCLLDETNYLFFPSRRIYIYTSKRTSRGLYLPVQIVRNYITFAQRIHTFFHFFLLGFAVQHVPAAMEYIGPRRTELRDVTVSWYVGAGRALYFGNL
jgi:hypothetical protein